MLAKAGEGDRAIKVKMVSWGIDQFSFFLICFWLFSITSPSTYSQENGKLEKPTEDETKILTLVSTLCIHIHIHMYIRSLSVHNLNPSH